MKQKNTPEHILEMLQELKKLLDEKKFDLQTFTIKYASYPAFRKYLVLKGIIKKEYSRYKWISIEPNIIMAKELIKLYLADIRHRREESEYYKKQFYKNKNEQSQPKEFEFLQEIEKTTPLKGKNTAMSLAKQIRQEGEVWTDAVKRASVIMKGGKTKTKEITLRKPTFEELFPNSFIQDLKKEIEEKNNNIESIEIKYKQLQEELIGARAVLINLKQELTNQEIANEGLKELIQIREKEIENLIRERKESSEYTNYIFPEVSKPQEKVDTSKGSKTYKLFGIPVFSINNK